MSLINAARKIARARSSENARYLQEQSSKYQTEFAQEKLSSANFVINPETGETVCAQAPMVANVVIVDNSGPSIIERTYETTPKPRFVLPNPGAPVDLTVDEIQRMTPEDRAVALARILAVDGARSRMEASKISGKTLTESLAAELEYQRALIRESSRIARDGKSKRHTKTQSKIDRKAGRPRVRQAGVASFAGPVFEVTSTLNGNPISAPGKSWDDPVDGRVVIRKRRASESNMLIINKAREK